MLSINDVISNFLRIGMFFKYNKKNVKPNKDIAKELSKGVDFLNEFSYNQNLEKLEKLNIFHYNIMSYDFCEKIDKTILKVIDLYKPPIIFLNEAVTKIEEEVFWKSKDFFKKYNYYFVPQEKKETQDGLNFQTTRDYNFRGSLILSKFKIIKNKHYFLPKVADFKEKHFQLRNQNLIYCQIDVNGDKIGLYLTHLENCVNYKGREVQMKYLEKIISENDDDRVILSGDMNTFYTTKLESGISYLKNKGFKTPFENEFRFLPRLDYIFFKGFDVDCVKKVKVKGEGSDHQPIMINVDLKS